MAIGIENSGFADPDASLDQGYWNKSSLNRAAYGEVVFNLTYGGSVLGYDLVLIYTTPPQYPYNNTKETSSGHVVEYDDTFGRERVLIKHRSGSGLELRPDGTVLISSTDKHIVTVQNDQVVIVEGDAKLVYNGNVNMDIIGDYNVNVGGNHNVTVAGNVTETFGARKDTSIEEGQTLEV